MKSVSTAIILHDDNAFLRYVIEAFKPYGEVFVFISRLPWAGDTGDWEGSVKIAEDAGANVVLGNWGHESLHRQAVITHMRGLGHRYIFIPDSDEIPEPGLAEKLCRIAESGIADKVRVRMDTYWKTTSHVVRPPEELAPILLLNVQTCEHRYIREFDGGTEVLLGREHGVLHHLSYVGSDTRIQKKISTWSHKHEVIQEWWQNKWLAWDNDPALRDLHPTHPFCFKQIERRDVPDILAGVDPRHPLHTCPETREGWPTVSVVIPLYGGEDDISKCLDSLEKCQGLLHEVLVVDDAGPDNAANVAERFGSASVIRRKDNGGFATACNEGLQNATGEVVIFLNSDTIVPRAGLIRLVESLLADEKVGAVGPVSNNIAYFQKIDVLLSSLDVIDGFAIDLANTAKPDEPISMLVGFCLAMRRELAEELGGFCTNFGKGMYEDNDLCYRIQRAGYELRICHRSFVYHKGSQSLARIDENPAVLMRRNEAGYLALHSGEVASGYASHLPSERREPIRFSPDRHPEAVRRRLKGRAEEADISLCMIVRDEERVIADCLTSACDVFNEIIVVDTGSTDRTMEIVEGFGAQMHEMVWPENFAAARNESLKYAKGKWIFWMDADDVLPPASAERILDAAINAPDWVIGFVVPVQFVDGPGGMGTRVDHVKLFRNFPGLVFEGRIHEQILGSLREHGGEIQRLDAVVLHSGYDTSEVGQAKKKKRDSKLLMLDLEDRPNHPFVLFNLGMTAYYNEEHEESITWFKSCLSVSVAEESHVRKVFALLSGSLRAIGSRAEAISILCDGLRLYPEDPELLFLRGVNNMEAGRFGEARLDLERIPEGVPAHFASFDTGIQGFKKYFNLGVCCGGLGDYVGERYYHLRAIVSGGDYIEPSNLLIRSALARRDYEVIEELVSLLETRDERGEFWGTTLAQLSIAQGLDPLHRFLQVQASNPHDPRIGVATAKYLLEHSRFVEAKPILDELRRSGIPAASFFMGVASANAGDIESAKQFFIETLKLDPGHAAAENYLKNLEESATLNQQI